MIYCFVFFVTMLMESWFVVWIYAFDSSRCLPVPFTVVFLLNMYKKWTLHRR